MQHTCIIFFPVGILPVNEIFFTCGFCISAVPVSESPWKSHQALTWSLVSDTDKSPVVVSLPVQHYRHQQVVQPSAGFGPAKLPTPVLVGWAYRRPHCRKLVPEPPSTYMFEWGSSMLLKIPGILTNQIQFFFGGVRARRRVLHSQI